MIDRRRFLRDSAIATAVGVFSPSIIASSASAQAFPSKPIVWIVPFGTGGVTDTGSRLLGQELTKILGQQVLVENRAGASGIIGTQAGIAAKPDGYTIVMGTSGTVAAHTYVFKKLPYEPLRDLAPIHGMSASPLVLAASVNKPFKTLDEFIAYAKANPKANYSSPGLGTAPHMLMEMLKKRTGINLIQAQYKTPTLALTDLVSGNIDITWEYAVNLKAQHEAGTLRLMAVTYDKRLPLFPDVPTTAEIGHPDLVMAGWSSVLAPAATPPDIVRKIADAFEEALRTPTVTKYYAEQGSAPMMGMGPAELRTFIEAETKKLTGLLRETGVEQQD